MTQAQRIVVLDSGGCTAKVGLAIQPDDCKTFPNCTAKIKGERGTLIGEDILNTRDVSSLQLRRPVDRGYVTAWEIQREIWSRALRACLNEKQDPSTLALILTEPYMNLPGLREAAMHVVFEELGFSALYMSTPASLALRYHASLHPELLANAAGCALVVDAGFSYTHAVPIFDWRVLKSAVRRIDLGGKALTNYMKELVSYRSVNMMDEAYLLEHIKNQFCFVSQDPMADLTAAKKRNSPHRIEYILPDGVTSTWGHVRDPAAAAGQPGNGPSKEAILLLNNERFMVPEALFHPSDIGMEEAGLAEAINDAITACHPHLHSLLYSNVLLIGGTTQCPGFQQRLVSELRPLVPDDDELGVYTVDDPVLAAWKGGAVLASSHELASMMVTKHEWRARGVGACGKWLE